MKTKKSYILNIALILVISGISLYLSVGSEVSTVLKQLLQRILFGYSSYVLLCLYIMYLMDSLQ